MNPSQCDRVLEVLADGLEHSISEIHERAGTMRLNSRVAELRKRGHAITCARVDGTYAYTLLDSPEEIERLGPDGSSGESSRDGRPVSTGASPSPLVQLSIFEAAA